MKNDLLFDFTIDKAAKTVFITREFAAELPLVWDAFTKQEILDQWTAPAPYIAKTKYMNFEVGGQRFYAMVSPEGQERWAIQKYTSITPKTNFQIFQCRRKPAFEAHFKHLLHTSKRFIKNSNLDFCNTILFAEIVVPFRT